jgi:hypothetical protein
MPRGFVMTRRLIACVVVLLGVAASAEAQQRAPTLSQIFQDLFGPNGLVVDSEAVLPDGSTHSGHFNSTFQANFTQFNVALASQLTSLPLPSPASGFTYRFDSTTGTFVRSSQSFGPILTDRAETIGRGRFSFGYNFQYFSFDQLEGISLSSVPSVFRHDDFQLGGGRADVVSTSNAISASVGQWTGALTYGVTDHFDISAAVPVVRTSLNVLSAATIQRVGTGTQRSVHFFRDPDATGELGSERTFESGGSASGLGDVIIRAKGEFMRRGSQGFTGGLDLRLPTGDERNLLGSGAWGARPFFAYSSSRGRVSPHVNVSYQWNSSSVLAGDPKTGEKADVPDQFQYALGADFGVNEKFSLTGDWISRLSIDSPRVRLVDETITGTFGSVTLQDIAFDRSSFWASSAAFGCKTNVKGRLLVDFNLRFTVGTNGLTDRVTPLIGLEYTF